jgi:hypothetical protein
LVTYNEWVGLSEVPVPIIQKFEASVNCQAAFSTLSSKSTKNGISSGICDVSKDAGILFQALVSIALQIVRT